MGRLLFNACGSKCLSMPRGSCSLGTRKMLLTLLVTCSPLRVYLQSTRCGEHFAETSRRVGQDVWGSAWHHLTRHHAVSSCSRLCSQHEWGAFGKQRRH
ncbi:hypothetical protein P171DRAFT_162851 [Karstenula rhodostoma CBS 690.94]|uniref:Uncharacterized protein n=1 Tax=Karstenula rhodostoma CBS 690.94 TaxID=1392251 RepID=A0A9P4P737_9PLEO|nr:hypothetical protein P171DRAFT_162851 [Karstenula rhodostoma CBS 690.94]